MIKRGIDIDLSLDPLYDEPYRRYKQPRLRKCVEKCRTTTNNEMDKVYEAIQFKLEYSDAPKQRNSSLKEYIKQQSKELQHVKFQKNLSNTRDNSVLLTDMDSNRDDSLPQIRQILQGRTVQNALIKSYMSKKRISDLILRMEQQQNKVNAAHTLIPQQTCRLESFDPEIQNIEIEQCVQDSSDSKENFTFQPIYSSKNKVGRNSLYNSKWETQQLNMQQVKEKLVFDMLKENVKCDLDPLRLQLFNLSRIMNTNRQLKGNQVIQTIVNKDKEAQELVYRSDTQRREIASEKRAQLNPDSLRFSFKEQDIKQSLHRNLDQRMSKNIQQRKEFSKMLQQFKHSQLDIPIEIKDLLEQLRQIILNGRPITLDDVRIYQHYKVVKIIINTLKL